MRKLTKTIITIFLVFSVLFTCITGFLILTNLNEIGKTLKVIALIKTYSINETDTSNLIEGSMKGIISALEDPYSSYLEPEVFEDMEERLHGVYAGVGLLISLNENGEIVVVTPFKGSPAQRAGITTGDIITAINNKKTTGMDLDTASNLMQGEPGTTVKIRVLKKNGEEKEYTVKRETIEIPSVEGKIIEGTDNLGYIHISSFNENTGKILRKKLLELEKEGMKGLVLDLRNNPGGALQVAVEISDLFLQSGPIVHIESKRETETFKATPGSIDIPMVVLINNGSASASEILAGAIQDTKKGVLIGQKTYGKGVVQGLFKFSDGSALKLTTAKYLTPNKRDINEKGIEPDIIVEMSDTEILAALSNAPDIEKDKQLKKAIEVLSKNLSK